jgi:murein DD-endopeptidase MepM/ murein hydrolase activator NlpD
MSARKRKRRPLTRRGTVRLAAVFVLLVGVNIYVFFFSKGSIQNVSRQAAEASMKTNPVAPPEPPAERKKTGRSTHGQVRENEALGALLRREGLTPPETDEVIRALRPVMNFRSELRPGQKYQLTFDDIGRLVSFKLTTSQLNAYIVERQPDGKLVGKKAQTGKTEIRVEQVKGVVASSLYDALKAAGESTSLTATLVDLFAYDLDFYVDCHPGDRFLLFVEKEYLDGKFWRYGKVLAAEYNGKAGRVRAFWWADAKGYFDGEGRAIARAMLKTPLKFARISSGFNPRRMHPVLHVERGHWGTDYAAPVGTPVWASAGGRLTHVGPRGGGGNVVQIDHGGGLQTAYLHLSKFAPGLRAGDRVKQKQVIGYVGMTGLSTGPHLHFTVFQNGRPVDSTKLVPKREAPLPSGQLPAFRTHVARWTGAMDLLATSMPVASAADPIQD